MPDRIHRCAVLHRFRLCDQAANIVLNVLDLNLALFASDHAKISVRVLGIFKAQHVDSQAKTSETLDRDGA